MPGCVGGGLELDDEGVPVPEPLPEPLVGEPVGDPLFEEAVRNAPGFEKGSLPENGATGRGTVVGVVLGAALGGGEPGGGNDGSASLPPPPLKRVNSSSPTRSTPTITPPMIRVRRSRSANGI